MNTLWEFLRKYSYVLLFLVLEGVSFTLLFSFNHYQGSAWFSSANSVVVAIDRFYSDVASYVGLRDANNQLTDENIRLQIENEALRERLRRIGHEPTATEKVIEERLAGYTLIPATVVSNSNWQGNHYLVVDQGTNQGVKAEMGVVGGGGVVGIVYLAGRNHSLVIPVTNRKSSISCRVRGENYFGYLQWDGKSLRSAYLDDIPRYAKIEKGAVVETSGYSAVFPPGIFVGRVVKVENSSDGQTFRLHVALGTDFARVRDIKVVATPYRAEMDSLRSFVEAADADGQK